MLARGKDMPLKKPASYPGKRAGLRRLSRTEQCKPQLVHQVRNHRITQWFRLERTLKVISFQSPAAVRDEMQIQVADVSWNQLFAHVEQRKLVHAAKGL